MRRQKSTRNIILWWILPLILPYDFYRPGEEEERLPIQLLMKSGDIRELSRESEIVDAISGKRRTDHKLYYPADLICDDTFE